MPGCNVKREEVVGSIAWYRMFGRFDGACAWELEGCLGREPLAELVLDFSQVSDFADYGVAVMASALLAPSGKKVHMVGLRQHQARLFKYFGIDAEELAHRSEEPAAKPPAAAEASKVA